MAFGTSHPIGRVDCGTGVHAASGEYLTPQFYQHRRRLVHHQFGADEKQKIAILNNPGRTTSCKVFLGEMSMIKTQTDCEQRKLD